jgi:hypothetical protein
MTDLNLALQCFGSLGDGQRAKHSGQASQCLGLGKQSQKPKHSGSASQCWGFKRESQKPQHSIKRGVLAEVGRRLGKSRSHVSKVMSGHYKSERIAAAICAAAGLRAADLWPGAYPRLEKLQALQAAEAARPPAH